eukprot:1505640-Rhodomonas_salina.4
MAFPQPCHSRSQSGPVAWIRKGRICSALSDWRTCQACAASRNQTQENGFLEQTVLRLCFLVFDFNAAVVVA